jgi:hypothetical protein
MGLLFCRLLGNVNLEILLYVNNQSIDMYAPD